MNIMRKRRRPRGGCVSHQSVAGLRHCHRAVARGQRRGAADLLAVVDAALNDEDVRPVADRVTVQSASIVNYAVEAVLYLYPGPEAEPARRCREKARRVCQRAGTS